jgi:hypothetical protein
MGWLMNSRLESKFLADATQAVDDDPRFAALFQAGKARSKNLIITSSTKLASSSAGLHDSSVISLSVISGKTTPRGRKNSTIEFPCVS